MQENQNKNRIKNGESLKFEPTEGMIKFLSEREDKINVEKKQKRVVYEKLFSLMLCIMWIYTFIKANVPLGVAAYAPTIQPAATIGLMPLVGLIAIWFGDKLGSRYNPNNFYSGRINAPSPGWLVKIIGWILLLVVSPIIYFLFNSLNN